MRYDTSWSRESYSRCWRSPCFLVFFFQFTCALVEQHSMTCHYPSHLGARMKSEWKDSPPGLSCSDVTMQRVNPDGSSIDQPAVARMPDDRSG